MEIYWISGSGPCWKVILLCELGELSYQSKRLDNSKGEQKTPEFLKLNPRGQVPLLVHEGFVLHQSKAILRYIDKAFFDSHYSGKTPEDEAHVEQLANEVKHYLEPVIQTIVRPIFRNKLELVSSILEKEAGTLNKELAYIDDILNDKKFLAGPKISLADIHLLPSVCRIMRGAKKLEKSGLQIDFKPLEPFNALKRWLTQMEKLNGYSAAFPPHWKD